MSDELSPHLATKEVAYILHCRVSRHTVTLSQECAHCEIDRLQAELAALTAENARLREYEWMYKDLCK